MSWHGTYVRHACTEVDRIIGLDHLYTALFNMHSTKPQQTFCTCYEYNSLTIGKTRLEMTTQEIRSKNTTKFVCY